MVNATEPTHVVRFADFELDLRTGELRHNGDHTILQEKPFKILAALLERTGEMVTREELTHLLWPAGTFVDFNQGLNKAVNRLRETLDDSADHPRFIETLPKRGYRFIAPVATPPLSANTPSPVSHMESNRRQDSERPDPYQWKRMAAMLVTVVILAVAFRFALGGWKPHSPNFDQEKMQITKLTNGGKTESVAISPDGRYLIYSLRERQGLGLWIRQVATDSDLQILPPDTVEFQGLSFSPDGTYVYFVRADKSTPDFRYLYVMPVLGGPARRLATDVDSPVSFSPNGRQFVYTRADPPRDVCEVRIANADGSVNHVLTTISGAYPGFQPGAVWAPDSRSIAVSFMLHGRQPEFVLDLISLRDGNIRTLYSSGYGIGRPAWLPSGDALLVSLKNQTGRGQLFRISYPEGETRRLTNDLADYDARIDATRDAGTVAAIQSNQVSNVWTAPVTDPSRGRQITTGGLPMLEVAPAAQGQVIAASAGGELLLMNVDGSHVSRVADVHGASNPASCGRFLLFSSSQPGNEGLMRANSDGSNPKMLAHGMIWSPVCSIDLQSVFYVDMAGPMKIWRVPIGGGLATVVNTIRGLAIESRLIVSPDGKFLAYAFMDNRAEPAMRLTVITVEGEPTSVLQVPGWAFERACLRWSPGGKSLQSLVTRNGVTNIWEQAVAGGMPRQLTKFTSGQIFDFNWSTDQRTLLLARGDVTSDAVLLSGFR